MQTLAIILNCRDDCKLYKQVYEKYSEEDNGRPVLRMPQVDYYRELREKKIVDANGNLKHQVDAKQR